MSAGSGEKRRGARVTTSDVGQNGSPAMTSAIGLAHGSRQDHAREPPLGQRISDMSFGQTFAMLHEEARGGIRDRHTGRKLLHQVIRVCKAAIRAGRKQDHGLALEILCPYTVVRDSVLRSTCFRALRYVVHTPEAARAFGSMRLVLPLARSLDRDHQYLLERTEALKLVRAVVQLAPSFAPRALVRSVVVLAQTPGESLRQACMDTLLTWAGDARTLRAMVSCNGIDTLASAVIDPEC